MSPASRQPPPAQVDDGDDLLLGGHLLAGDDEALRDDAADRRDQRGVADPAVRGHNNARLEGNQLVQDCQPACEASAGGRYSGHDLVLHNVAGDQGAVGVYED